MPSKDARLLNGGPIDSGTLARLHHEAPVPTCATRPSGIQKYTRGLEDVRQALWRGIDNYAYTETLNKLGSDLKLIVDSLWPGFMQALKIYAWSIGSGAAVLGTVGAVLGEGVGAAPGAFLGAEIGAEIGTLILTFLGLEFLAEYVLSHLDEASDEFANAFKTAWDACGNSATIDRAAKEFARGIADLFSLVLEAAAAWVLKKGLKAGLQELNKSDMGRALAPYAKIEYWREKLGITDAPVPRRGLAETIKFFDDQVKNGKLDKNQFTDEEKLKSYWKAMDFSKQISQEMLSPGKELVGYRDPSSPFGYYYAEVGTYLDKLGVDYVTQENLPAGVAGPPKLVKRQFIRYRVKANAKALKSTASGARAWDTNELVPGGATQYFIPRAREVLDPLEKKGGGRARGAPAEVAEGLEETVTVGRWMSEEEYSAMVRTGRVQESRAGGAKGVLYPPNPASYKAAPPGDIYVEFDVPKSILEGKSVGQVAIPGPNSLRGRLAVQKGLSPPQMPRATNIRIVGKK